MEPLVGGLVSGKLQPHCATEGQEALPQEFRSNVCFHIRNLSWGVETPDASTRGIPWPPSSLNQEETFLFQPWGRGLPFPLMFLMSSGGRVGRAACSMCIRKHLVPGSVTSGKSWPSCGLHFTNLQGHHWNEMGSRCRHCAGSQSYSWL